MQVVDCQSEVDCTMPQATNSHDCKKNFEMTFSQNKLFPFTKMTSIVSTLHSLQAYDIFFFLLSYPCFKWQGDLWKFLKPREINLAKTVPHD